MAWSYHFQWVSVLPIIVNERQCERRLCCVTWIYSYSHAKLLSHNATSLIDAELPLVNLIRTASAYRPIWFNLMYLVPELFVWKSQRKCWKSQCITGEPGHFSRWKCVNLTPHIHTKKKQKKTCGRGLFLHRLFPRWTRVHSTNDWCTTMSPYATSTQTIGRNFAVCFFPFFQII